MSSEIKVDTISEKTSAGGVTIDGLTIKDGGINEASLTLKNTATADNSTFTLNLQTAEADIAADDVIAKINFQAPDEGTGTDANLIAASIQATSEGDFSSSSNATKLEFMTGSSEAAATKMTISSAGLVGINTAANSSYYYNDLVVNSGDEGGITILDTSSGQSALAFADGTSGTARYMGRVLYDHDSNTMSIGAGGSTYLDIDGDGHVTNTSQPCFLAQTNSSQTNVADGWVTVSADHEIFDQNADYNTTTYTFTAPVTGKYLLNVKVSLEQVPNDYHWIYAGFGTSNRTHYGDLRDLRSALDDGDTSSGDLYSMSATTIADMDANDTAYSFIRTSAHGTNIMDITVSGTTNPDTAFSGYLLC